MGMAHAGAKRWPLGTVTKGFERIGPETFVPGADAKKGGQRSVLHRYRLGGGTVGRWFLSAALCHAIQQKNLLPDGNGDCGGFPLEDAQEFAGEKCDQFRSGGLDAINPFCGGVFNWGMGCRGVS